MTLAQSVVNNLPMLLVIQRYYLIISHNFYYEDLYITIIFDT